MNVVDFFISCFVVIGKNSCYLYGVWMSKIRRDNFKLSFHTFKGGFGHLLFFSNSALILSFVCLVSPEKKSGVILTALSLYIT